MIRRRPFHFLALILAVTVKARAADSTVPLQIGGLEVIPHTRSSVMQYRQAGNPELGVLARVFLRNTGGSAMAIDESLAVHLRGVTPTQLLANGDWTWHDTPAAWPGAKISLPPGALTVWSFNTRGTNWCVGTRAKLSIGPTSGLAASEMDLAFDEPKVWLSAVTFLGPTNSVQPDSLIFHVANESDVPLRIQSCRLWLPAAHESWQALLPREPVTQMDCFPSNGVIPPKDRGGARVVTGPLPLTYTAIEIQLAGPDGKPVTLWSHLRVKREVFDISGGWVASKLGTSNTLCCEPYLKTLRRMHINTGHIAETPGYTDNSEQYAKYPLKYFNKLEPFSHYDTDAMLPRIHAVEFLGEPQYGGGRPVPPQEVWQKLAPYQHTRLATTVTHSEERIWRYYAGLSDYPHYDAYRVNAPAPDAWSKYNRWNGRTIRWGAPLETIGDMNRSLRELNRPRPIAYWSQGPNNWDSYGGRQRTSPTPDELRGQAYHALASRITSLYWFNLSLKSLLKFPDLIEPITRVGREIRMLDDYYLEGDATSHERILRDGKPDWDLDVVAGPRGALMFALDLNYEPDPKEKIFKFGAPRDVTFRFRLPAYASNPTEVFRVDADGVTAMKYKVAGGRLEIQDRTSRTAVYVAATSVGERERIEARRKALIAEEDSYAFDPGNSPADLAVLKQLLNPTTK